MPGAGVLFALAGCVETDGFVAGAGSAGGAVLVDPVRRGAWPLAPGSGPTACEVDRLALDRRAAALPAPAAPPAAADELPAINPLASVGCQGTSGAQLVYLNRLGATVYRAESNNSFSNRSSLLHQRDSATIPAWEVNSADWAAVLRCLREQFAAYHLVFVDEDPGAVSHIEAVIGGNPADLDRAALVGGVAPFAEQCLPVPNPIVFIFAEFYAGQEYQTGKFRRICEVIAHEIGHTFGLDHSHYCPDNMTYLEGCGEKWFRDQSVPCGESEERPCECGATQNPAQKLLVEIGVRPAAGAQPVLSIREPRGGTRVPPGFILRTGVKDDVCVTGAELYIDGQLAAVDTSEPFSFVTPASVQPGQHTFEVRAFDSGNNETSASVQLEIDPAAPSPALGEDVAGGCAVAGRGGVAGWWLALLLLTFRRRRRAAR